MLLKFFLLFVMFVSAYAGESLLAESAKGEDYAKDTAWYTKIHPTVEAAIYLSDFQGTLSNAAPSVIDFKDDFKYANTASSFFSVETRFDYDYVPNIYISYFNMTQKNDVNISRGVTMVSTPFTNAATNIDYKVLNAVFFQDFKAKGAVKKGFYLGDIELDIGANLKVIDYLVRMKDNANPSAIYMYDKVDALIVLPYAGFKYYRYNFVLFGNISSLSYSESKATSYQFGIEYQVIKNIYLGYSYMYEDFQAIEKKDHIDFRTIGNKFSIKYAF
ncbi:MAG: hypothetical protein Q7S59_06195 [Sulfurimonas sp.]|nr:hypothetical protein [Sulfurimonas sp.]